MNFCFIYFKIFSRNKNVTEKQWGFFSPFLHFINLLFKTFEYFWLLKTGIRKQAMEWILPAMCFYTSLRYSVLITPSGKTFGENHHLCMLVYIWWIFTEVSEEFRLSKASPSSEIWEAVKDFSFLCFQCPIGWIQVEQKWKLLERKQSLGRESRERCWARILHLGPGRVKHCDTNYSQKKKQKSSKPRNEPLVNCSLQNMTDYLCYLSLPELKSIHQYLSFW